jgi:hypothetical protein
MGISWVLSPECMGYFAKSNAGKCKMILNFIPVFFACQISKCCYCQLQKLTPESLFSANLTYCLCYHLADTNYSQNKKFVCITAAKVEKNVEF